MSKASIPELVEVITQQAANVQFDFIIGRNVLVSELDKSNAVQEIVKILPQRGKLILAETVPRFTQRFYRLLEAHPVDSKLYKRLMSAEEAIYDDGSDPMLNWDVDDLRDAFKSAGLEADVIVEQNSTQMHISSHFLERLFTDSSNRPSYAQRLGRNLTLEELQKVKAIFAQYLLNQTILWKSTIAFIQANRI
ncbi:hypothetical protein ACN23B_27375 (plasmid) [Anabaena sp. FACHB-709]|uniref:Methyltransferase type 11 domain-containing protein n=1 Tax=Anabaena cylindrica FACHB-318 TaxID=2692880 RepID=A0ABR7ZQX9_ANACY|nr:MULTISPECIES: hypothetical protein [Nostocaceae]MBD2174948.1 hypothetical protein [Anabaena cylindrica FACHB-318]MBD2266703.1 hypothetical protein [Anabaena sp. FACHB-709]MBD2276349.1 hypothetical protein [Nostoc sp. PCC 7120 = FACHB-418]MBD2286923.1 hypothetical protein [Anabaena cylindrica FACHB-170]RUR72765.1 hypothetical protein DSM107007_56380 [Nostoc sp. PCC 7120 = FACHB-418]